MKGILSKLMLTSLLCVGIALPSLAQSSSTSTTTTTTTDQGAGHDIKDAGKSTKSATKKTYHKTKHTTKKGVHKAAHKTSQGANKVEDKTSPQ